MFQKVNTVFFSFVFQDFFTSDCQFSFIDFEYGNYIDEGASNNMANIAGSYASPEDPCPAGTLGGVAWKISVYATYTASGGATNVSWRSLLGVGL